MVEKKKPVLRKKPRRDREPRTKEDLERELAELTKDLPELEKEVKALVARRGW